MRKLGLILAAVAAVAILPGTYAWADHAPSKRKADAKNAETLKARLMELGMSDAAAKSQVASLTSKEIAYFAEDPARVQVVGALWAEEWVLGGAFLGACIAVGATLLINASDN